jgi:prophage regulatory protein
MTRADGAMGGGAPPGGQDDRLLPWRQVRAVAGISRSTAWRLQQVGDFPKPIPVSPGRVGWWESELNAWKAGRAAAAEAAARPEPPRRRRLEPPRAPKLIQTVRQPRPVVLPEGRVQTAEPPAPIRGRRRARRVDPAQTDFGF